MKIFNSPEDRRRGLAYLVLAIGFLIGLYLGARAYAPFIFDAAELRTWIQQFGVFAPLVFILIQLLQVIFAPIPGQVVAVVAGYLFGWFWGTLYSMIGVVIGSLIAFWLAKRYGRSLAESVIHEELMNGFDSVVDRIGVPGLFVIFIIPGLPDDAICFLAGLTKIRTTTFFLILTVGRLPAYILAVSAGGSLASGKLFEAAILITVLVVASVLGYLKQDEIKHFLTTSLP